MSILVLIACSGLLLLVTLFVSQPLLRSKAAGLRIANSNRRWLLLSTQRDAFYSAIQELDFDRDVGKVSEEDYVDQHAALEASALDILRELDQLRSADVVAVEARVRKDVRALVNQVDVPIESEGSANCPTCGGDRLANHRYCPHCGARLEVSD